MIQIALEMLLLEKIERITTTSLTLMISQKGVKRFSGISTQNMEILVSKLYIHGLFSCCTHSIE